MGFAAERTVLFIFPWVALACASQGGTEEVIDDVSSGGELGSSTGGAPVDDRSPPGSGGHVPRGSGGSAAGGAGFATGSGGEGGNTGSGGDGPFGTGGASGSGG
ncbi:MAG TPA: hypothetical protein VN764_15640, partial [Polyangiaceae bacterium]|nr:hypothetical protein [Polyangiaceae bacterium]